MLALHPTLTLAARVISYASPGSLEWNAIPSIPVNPNKPRIRVTSEGHHQDLPLQRIIPAVPLPKNDATASSCHVCRRRRPRKQLVKCSNYNRFRGIKRVTKAQLDESLQNDYYFTKTRSLKRVPFHYKVHCRIRTCKGCLKSRFGHSSRAIKSIDKKTFQCYVCRGECVCTKCKKKPPKPVQVTELQTSC